MQVYKACLKIVNRRKAALLIYLGIFLAISVALTSMYGQGDFSAFEPVKPLAAVVDRDADSGFGAALAEALAGSCEIVPLRDDSATLRDALYFGGVDVVLIVSEGFWSALFSAEPLSLAISARPDSGRGALVQSAAEEYLRLLQLTAQAYPALEGEALLARAASSLAHAARAERVQLGDVAPVDESYAAYAKMLGYILPLLSILGLSTITLVFDRGVLRMRNLLAPVRPRALHAQLFLGACTLGAVFYAVLLGLGTLLYANRLSGVDARVQALVALDAFLLMVMSMCMAYFVSQFLRTPNAQNAAANFLSLAFAFLGGTFVPLEVMGEAALAVARYTPVYWYVRAVEAAQGMVDFSAASVLAALRPALMLPLYALAFACAALAVARTRRQSAGGFVRTVTELEK